MLLLLVTAPEPEDAWAQTWRFGGGHSVLLLLVTAPEPADAWAQTWRFGGGHLMLLLPVPASRLSHALAGSQRAKRTKNVKPR